MGVRVRVCILKTGQGHMRWKETGNYLLLLTSLEIDQFKITWNLRKGQNRRKSGNREKWRESRARNGYLLKRVKYEKISNKFQGIKLDSQINHQDSYLPLMSISTHPLPFKEFPSKGEK